jgi:hypothetical protein
MAGTGIRAMKTLDKNDHRLLVLWAVECAEHVLPDFENNHPGDDRPRKALEKARQWVIGKSKTSEIRKTAFASHAAARDATSPGAIAAARSAGHAAATAHVPGHAIHAASYAVKASVDPTAEREWQLHKLPEKIKPVYFSLTRIRMI